MYKPVLFIAAAVSLGLFAETSWAKVVRFEATVSQVRAGCSKAGGKFGVHADGGGYGCVNANCDGKGNNCQVHCNNNNQCVGTTPGRARPGMSIEQVLGYGFGAATGTKAPAGAIQAPAGSILDSSPGFSSQGPAATGAPAPRSPSGGVIIR